MIPKECKRLAEVDFAIAVVSKHSALEKSIRHGHPSTLHLGYSGGIPHLGVFPGIPAGIPGIPGTWVFRGHKPYFAGRMTDVSWGQIFLCHLDSRISWPMPMDREKVLDNIPSWAYAASTRSRWRKTRTG